MPVFTYSFTPTSCELKRKPKVEEPKKKIAKRRHTRRRVTPKPSRRRKTVVRKPLARLPAAPRRYATDDTVQETWVCDRNGVCKLVKKQHMVSPVSPVGSAPRIGSIPGVNPNTVPLLSLANGGDGQVYCAVSDGFNGKKWAQCGTMDSKNCKC